MTGEVSRVDAMMILMMILHRARARTFFFVARKREGSRDHHEQRGRHSWRANAAAQALCAKKYRLH